MDEKPTSLDHYWGFAQGSRFLPKDVKNLLVQFSVGQTGWWYKKTVLDIGGFSPKLVMHPKEPLLAVVCKKAACVWDFEGTKQATLEHKETVNDVAFHPQNGTVMTVSEDGNALLWDLAGKKLHKYRHPVPLQSVVFNAQGNFFATVCVDKVFMWQNDIPRPTLRSNNKRAIAAFHPQENTIAVLLETFLWLRNLDTGKEKLFSHKKAAKAVTFHPQGTHVAIIESRTHQAIVWDLENESRIKLPHAHPVYSLAFNPKNSMVATSAHTTACLWSLEGVKQCTLQHKGIVGSLCFSPQGNVVATGSHDTTTCLWDLRGTKKATFACDSLVIRTAFNAQGNICAILTDEGRVILYQKHEKPSFAQLLMRGVLKRYFQECIAGHEVPEVCATQADVPVWMAQKFNINKDELMVTWQSMPEALQKSIFSTLLYRRERIKAIYAKKNAKDEDTQVDYV